MLRKPPEPPPDPEARLVGKCGTCGSRVEVAAWEATSGVLGKSSDPFADLRWVQCPTWLTLYQRCGSRVYLMPKPVNPE